MNSRCSMLVCVGRSASNFLFGWLTETWTQYSSLMRFNKLKMPELFWYDEGGNPDVQGDCHVGLDLSRVTYPLTIFYVKGQEDTPFTKAMWNILVRGAPLSLKSSVVSLPFRPVMTVGDATLNLHFWFQWGWWYYSIVADVKWKHLTINHTVGTSTIKGISGVSVIRMPWPAKIFSGN